MTNQAANDATLAILQAFLVDLGQLGEDLDIALDDISAGNRLGAIGALAGADEAIERIGAMVAAARAINRAARV